MKKLLGVLLALAVLALAPTFAEAQVLRPNADGTSDWVSNDGRADYEIGVSRYTVLLENIGTASTAYVVIPEAGTIFQVDSVISGVIATANETLNFSVGGNDAFGTITVTQSGSAIGDRDTASVSQAVTAGQVFAIDTQGDSANDVDVVVTISVRR
jgi:hypothetical protein